MGSQRRRARLPAKCMGGHSMHPPQKTALHGSGRPWDPIPILSHAQPPPNTGCRRCAQQSLGTGRRGAGGGCGKQRPPQPHAGTPREGP